MIRSESGATDILSSLPIIACCIVSVMILVGTLSHALVGGAGDSETESLIEESRSILSTALDRLTSVSQDGRRYIAHDWKDRLMGIDFELDAKGIESASIEVRVFNQAPYELSIRGNISLCLEVRSASEPMILVDQGGLEPGEIIVKVGR